MTSQAQNAVIFDVTDGRIEDLINLDGTRTLYSDVPVDDYIAKGAPGQYLALPLHVAVERAQAAARIRYACGVVEASTPEQYDDALNVLPPCQWSKVFTAAGYRYEVFHISERLEGNIVQWYAKGTDGRCWTLREDGGEAGKIEVIGALDALDDRLAHQADQEGAQGTPEATL